VLIYNGEHGKHYKETFLYVHKQFVNACEVLEIDEPREMFLGFPAVP
jgi:hypothetical protein